MKCAIAKVFMTGRSQAVRIPKEFRFDCDEVNIERRGQTITLRPKPKGWREYFKHQIKLSDDFEIPDDPPPEPVKGF